MFEHREADRIPIIDSPWRTTIKRWHREGLPQNQSWVDYFGIDQVERIWVDNSPRFPEQIIKETEEYKIYTTKWGATQKEWKHVQSTPEFLDFSITDPDAWHKTKRLIQPDPDRVDWKKLRENYSSWISNGAWIQAGLWFGFDVTHSWIVGTERFLLALIENPEWCQDMFGHLLDVNLKLLNMVWNAGYEFDSIWWPDDMGYKHNQFFSLQMYRDLLKPFHQKAIDWAHAKGIKVHLHSCGDINPFIPDLIDMGLDALNPLEVKAGMDPIHLKKTYGKELVLNGGINAVLWDDPDAIANEMRRLIPVLKESGGYIFSSDHSVPSSVSLDAFRKIIELAKALGTY
jgi:uroporphyrinogen decarboxylase